MSIPAVEFIPVGSNIEQLAFNQAQPATQPFSNWLQGQVADLNGAIAKSDALTAQLAAGQTNNLHQVMISMEEAKIAFQLAVQVRNRLLEAYQEVSRMQI